MTAHHCPLLAVLARRSPRAAWQMKRLRLIVACEIVEEGGRNRRFQYTLAQTLLKLWLFFLPLVAARRAVVPRRFVRHVVWAACLRTQ